MILKISQKTNSAGWQKQMIIDFENKTIKKGAFLFRSGDVDGLSVTQYKQVIEYLKNNDFVIVEG